MLGQLLIRRISSKQIAFTENAFWRRSIASKCYSLSPVKERTSRACRTVLDLHTFAYRIHSARCLPHRTGNSPLMKGFVSSFKGTASTIFASDFKCLNVVIFSFKDGYVGARWLLCPIESWSFSKGNLLINKWVRLSSWNLFHIVWTWRYNFEVLHLTL